MTDTPTVFVVDDDQAMRSSLQWLIEPMGLPVETFDSATAFLTGYQAGRPGCLLLDVRMPDMSGLELQRHLADADVALPVIIITGHGDVTMAVKAMKAGAVDFIEKPFDDDVLLAALRAALDRARRRQAGCAERSTLRARFAELTPREYEVMTMVTEGLSNREIAAVLGVTAKTVEAHRARVMDKMQAGSLAELVRMAIAADVTRAPQPAN